MGNVNSITMKRLCAFVLLIYNTMCIYSQSEVEVFEGYLFSEDSIPVENAHLINYRNMKIVLTDSKGYFHLAVEEGDSVMINHISLKPTVIHSNYDYATDNIYFITYKMYTLSMCLSEEKDYTVDKENAVRNIDKLYSSIEKLGYKRNSNIRVPQRNDLPLNLGGRSGSASLNLLSVKDLIKQGRRNKYLTAE